MDRLNDILFLAHELLFTDRPREELAAALRRSLDPIDFSRYPTLVDFMTALSGLRDTDQAFNTLAAFGYLFCQTSTPREEIAKLFSDVLPEILDVPEWAALWAELEGPDLNVIQAGAIPNESPTFDDAVRRGLVVSDESDVTPVEDSPAMTWSHRNPLLPKEKI